jgi:hypothetical protein
MTGVVSRTFTRHINYQPGQTMRDLGLNWTPLAQNCKALPLCHTLLDNQFHTEQRSHAVFVINTLHNRVSSLYFIAWFQYWNFESVIVKSFRIIREKKQRNSHGYHVLHTLHCLLNNLNELQQKIIHFVQVISPEIPNLTYEERERLTGNGDANAACYSCTSKSRLYILWLKGKGKAIPLQA